MGLPHSRFDFISGLVTLALPTRAIVSSRFCDLFLNLTPQIPWCLKFRYMAADRQRLRPASNENSALKVRFHSTACDVGAANQGNVVVHDDELGMHSGAASRTPV